MTPGSLARTLDSGLIVTLPGLTPEGSRVADQPSAAINDIQVTMDTKM